jgi:hypothetical protein
MQECKEEENKREKNLEGNANKDYKAGGGRGGKGVIKYHVENELSAPDEQEFALSKFQQERS